MFKNYFICRKKFLHSPAESPCRIRFSALIFAAVLLSFCGCQTVPGLPPVNLSEPGWTVHQGQAVWRSKKGAPELTGELLVAINPDGRSFVQFTKTPLPFFVAQTTSNSWQFEVVPRHKIYSYRGHPPTRLLWPNLPACAAGAPPPKNWDWQRRADGGFLFENSSTGESLEGYLNP